MIFFSLFALKEDSCRTYRPILSNYISIAVRLHQSKE